MKNTDLLLCSNASEMRITVTMHTEDKLQRHEIRREARVAAEMGVWVLGELAWGVAWQKL